MTVRERAHHLIDSIPPDRLPALVGVLEMLAPRNGREYPIEDEHVSEDENAQAAASSGSGIPIEDVLAEYGLTIEGILERSAK
jgi:hypothetical protein